MYSATLCVRYGCLHHGYDAPATSRIDVGTQSASVVVARGPLNSGRGRPHRDVQMHSVWCSRGSYFRGHAVDLRRLCRYDPG